MVMDVLPCPRCGVEPRIWYDDTSDYERYSVWRIECWECDEVAAKTKSEAVELWNDRHYIKMLVTEIDDLKSVITMLKDKIADLEWKLESNSK